MIYKFKSKAGGDVIMLAETGDKVLSLIGKDKTPQGIVEPAQMPAAIQALADAVTADDAARAAAKQGDPDAAAGGTRDPVPLRQRAWPLVELLKRAHAAGEPVTWGV
jgi:putative intracellular protease/amidase